MENELQNETQIENEVPVQKKKSGYTFYIVLAAIVLFILGFRLWFTSNYGIVDVDGASMNQTLQHGEKLLMHFVKDGKGLERGDIIVVYVGDYPEIKEQNDKLSLEEKKNGEELKYVIKRLIAIEGDKVKCEDGQISICRAGTDKFVPLPEPYAYYGGRAGYDETDYDFGQYTYTVGEGEIFFLGDNRLNSCDSRYKEYRGSHLKDKLYKATDVYGVVPDWAVDYKEILDVFF